jgi:hypothetical protein
MNKLFVFLNSLTKPLSSSIKSKGLEYKEIQLQRASRLATNAPKKGKKKAKEAKTEQNSLNYCLL